MLWAAWHFNGCDPYVLYHGDGAPPSPHPERLQVLTLGFAAYSAQREVELATGRAQRRMLGA